MTDAGVSSGVSEMLVLMQRTRLAPKVVKTFTSEKTLMGAGALFLHG